MANDLVAVISLIALSLCLMAGLLCNSGSCAIQCDGRLVRGIRRCRCLDLGDRHDGLRFKVVCGNLNAICNFELTPVSTSRVLTTETKALCRASSRQFSSTRQCCHSTRFKNFESRLWNRELTRIRGLNDDEHLHADR